MPFIIFHLLRLRCSRTGTPGLSGGLVTSVLRYGVRLTLVLGHAGVDMPVRLLANIPIFPSLVGGVGVGDFVLDNVGTDRRLEDIGQGVGVLAGSPIGANDRDSRTRHLDNCVVSRYGANASNRRLVAPSESSTFIHFAPAANLWAGSVHAVGSLRAGLGSCCERLPLALARSEREGKSDRSRHHGPAAFDS
jgi:hypothetical protein